jgi:hypothetical protein
MLATGATTTASTQQAVAKDCTARKLPACLGGLRKRQGGKIAEGNGVRDGGKTRQIFPRLWLTRVGVSGRYEPTTGRVASRIARI